MPIALLLIYPLIYKNSFSPDNFYQFYMLVNATGKWDDFSGPRKGHNKA